MSLTQDRTLHSEKSAFPVPLLLFVLGCTLPGEQRPEDAASTARAVQTFTLEVTTLCLTGDGTAYRWYDYYSVPAGGSHYIYATAVQYTGWSGQGGDPVRTAPFSGLSKKIIAIKSSLLYADPYPGPEYFVFYAIIAGRVKRYVFFLI